MAGESEARIGSGYDAFYEAWGRSELLRRLWRDHVTGAGFPAEFEHISFLPLPVLEELTAGLRLGAGDQLVDLACGAGGPGLWAAAQTGAVLTGVDLSAVAVRKATERVGPLGLEDRATFRQGTFADTGLPEASADAVMTVDALQYAPDQAAALAEVARILRPGGRFAFLAFELDATKVAGLGVWEDPVGDYRPALDDAGFDVVSYKQVDGWHDAVTGVYAAIVEQQEPLTAELGELAATALVLEATITLQLEPYAGHVFAVAERRR